MIGKLVMAAITATALFTTGMFATGAAADPVVLTPAEQQQIDFMHQPEDWFVAHLKGPREKPGTATLDARLQYVLENVTRPASTPAMQGAIRAAYTTPEGRANGRAALERYWLIRTTETKEMKSVADTHIKGRDGNDILLRVYHPNSADKTLPVLVYYHGGGFMFGSVAGWDRTARLIANEANVIVVSVDYRLAPENPYPAAWSDAEDAYRWTLANATKLGGGKVSVGGDSAGGTLAIAVALRAVKAQTTPPAALLLYYPGVDLVGEHPSLKTYGTGYGLDADNLAYLANLVYPAGIEAPPADTSSVQADLCGLPRTLVISAGFDPLQDSQGAFVDKLQGAHVSAQHLHYETLIHGFLQTSAYVPDAFTASTQSAQRFGVMLRQPAKAKPACP